MARTTATPAYCYGTATRASALLFLLPWSAPAWPADMDQPWQDLINAWVGKTDYKPTRVGIGYMLAGDCPISNIDPYAEGPTADNQWIHNEGPHIMVIVPDAASLEGLPTDPYSGKPYVMWKGTLYQHIMIPTAGN